MRDILLRTFVAIPIPETIRPVYAKLKATVPGSGLKIKWVRSDLMHLTLKFLGYTPESSVEDVRSVFAKLVKPQSAFNLSICNTGCFPKPERPRVLWMGIEGDLDHLKNLVNQINSGLEPLGFLVEEKSFVPHLTIARIRYPQKKTPDITSFLNISFDPIPVAVNKIQFISSELFSNGPVYSILSTHFFGNNSI
ncbi:MAG: RNA 2',3'-cyclic phosphodiesterase [Fidelibacterota bacterium]